MIPALTVCQSKQFTLLTKSTNGEEEWIFFMVIHGIKSEKNHFSVTLKRCYNRNKDQECKLNTKSKSNVNKYLYLRFFRFCRM